jgi:hypothetical protein
MIDIKNEREGRGKEKLGLTEDSCPCAFQGILAVLVFHVV